MCHEFDIISKHAKNLRWFIIGGFILLFRSSCLVRGQCEGGTLTFEKITGKAIRGSSHSVMYDGNGRDESITSLCSNKCRITPDCAAFLINYGRRTCYQMTSNSEGRRELLSSTQDATNYFEKICLKAKGCKREWIFERVIGRELAGFDDRVIGQVSSRIKCEEFCLKEVSFPCRSGEYDYVLQQCRLSSEDRRSQPSSFRPSIGDVDYFENQCVSHSASGCEYNQYPDVDLGLADLERTSFSPDQCQTLCDTTETFVCRSFTFQPSTALCWLSGDDTLSAGSKALKAKPGTFYYQRSNCLDLKLTCSPESMVLTLTTLEPFTGRIFAKNRPRSCEIFGNGQTVNHFILSLDPAECGAVNEGKGRHVNTVVIQHHPVIQRKGDRIIKLLCIFETLNHTVSNSYNVIISDDGTATGIVNATAPSPQIRLRITDRNGLDINGARVGEELYLRIEIDDDSVFGIFARDLIATSGKTDEFITLIDSRGCPTDTNIFPPLERVPGTRALQGRFDAFKFPDDVVVRFRVSIHFCLDECEPVSCSEGVSSFGKRKKRQIVSSTTPVLNDYPLQREIIVEGITVTRITESPNSDDESSNKEKVCTTKTIMVVAIIAAISVQIGILAVCVTCIVLNRRTVDKEETMSPSQSRLSFFGSGGRGGTLRSIHQID